MPFPFLPDDATAVESIVVTVSPQPADVMPVAADVITVAANDLAVAATDTAADSDNVAQEVAEDTAVAIEAEPATELPVADINLAATVLPETPADVDDTTSVQTVIETVAPNGDATIIITPEAVATEVVASVIPDTEAITGEKLHIDDDHNFIKKSITNSLHCIFQLFPLVL